MDARYVRSLYALVFLLLTACGQGFKSANERPDHLPGSTGYFKGEVDYTDGGDPRVGRELEKPSPEPDISTTVPVKTEPPKSNTPAAPATTVPRKVLQERLREFEIWRTDAAGKSERFGAKAFKIRIFFTDEETKAFAADFKGSKSNLELNATTGNYTLSGTLQDYPTQSVGEFHLRDNTNGEMAVIFYRAYKAKLNIRENVNNPAKDGSTLACQLKDLREHSFGWVNNWVVVRGASFYLVAVVTQHDTGAKSLCKVDLPPLSFSGESMRTGLYDHPTRVLGGSAEVPKVELIGDSTDEAARTFAVTFKDPEAGAGETGDGSHKVMIDMDIENPNEVPDLAPAPKPDEVVDLPPVVAPDSGVDDEDQIEEPAPLVPLKPEVTTPTTPSNPDVKPPPEKPADETPAIQVKPTGKEFFTIETSKSRLAAKMTEDWNKNSKVKRVTDRIELFKKNKTDLQKYYIHANPFRGIIMAAARAYKVTAAFAYVTFRESNYFKGLWMKKGLRQYYKIQASGTGPIGPFQISQGTGDDMGMLRDERKFAAPSACGAARRFAQIAKQFSDRDTTVAILGYYQGPTGAENQIKKATDQANDYVYTYEEMSRRNLINSDFLNYVAEALAVYFISANPTKYGFSLDDVRTKLPSNGTILTGQAIHDPTCREAMSKVKMSYDPKDTKYVY